MKLYHGSQEENFVPTFGLGNDGHDYGRGFYTTADRDLGLEWAVGQQATHDGWLHVYEADLSSLKVFDFAEVGVLAWLAELMKHRPVTGEPTFLRYGGLFIERYGVDVSACDMIKGWRADASYFFIAQMFVSDQIDVSLLDELLRLGDLGVQYFFKSERAFAALRELPNEKESVPLSVYKEKFNRRDLQARRRMEELVFNIERNQLERTFSDLIKEAN